MIPIPSGVRVWIATGHTHMRRGMQSLALTVSVGNLETRLALIRLLWRRGWIVRCRALGKRGKLIINKLPKRISVGFKIVVAKSLVKLQVNSMVRYVQFEDRLPILPGEFENFFCRPEKLSDEPFIFCPVVVSSV